MVFTKSRQIIVLIVSFFIFSMLIIPQPISAQLNDEWKKSYGGEAKDIAKSVIFTNDGGLLIAGSTRSFGPGKLSNFHLIKTNNNGYTEWKRTYGGKYNDEAEDIIQTQDGGYAIAGSSESFKGKAQDDFYMIKTDSEGRKQWDFGDGGDYDEKCYSIVQTDDGGYLLAGSTITFGDRGEDFWVIKVDSNGNKTWSKTYGGDGDDICRSIIKTGDGNYLLAGHTDSFGDPGQGSYLIKINEEGEKIWERASGGPFDDYVYDVILDEDGGFVYVGSTTSYGSGEESFWLVKTDPEGHEEWNYSSDGDYDEVAYSVVKTDNGNYLMGGYTSSYGQGGRDFWAVEVDQEGEVVSKKTFGSGGDEIAYSVAKSENGKYALAGYTDSYGAGQSDFWVVKIGKPYRIPVLWVVVGSAGIVATVVIAFKLSKKYRLF